MPVRVALKEPVEDTWLILHQTFISIAKCKDDAFTTVGLPYQQFVVISAIRHLGAKASLTNIAIWLDLNPTSVTFIIDRMEKNGLVKRVRDLKDRRRIRLVITAEGEAKRKQALKPAREISEKLLSVLSPEELSTFATLLRKVREATFEYRNIKDKVINMVPTDNNSIDESHALA